MGYGCQIWASWKNESVSLRKDDTDMRKRLAISRATLNMEIALARKQALAWAAKWIEDSVPPDADARLKEFAANMAMTIRAEKSSSFSDFIRNASADEKKRVYEEVLRKASERQTGVKS